MWQHFVVTYALRHLMYGSCVQVHELPQSHCGDNWKDKKLCKE